MSVQPSVTCKLNLILTIFNPYRTYLSRTLVCDDPCSRVDLDSKFDSIIRDTATWDRMFVNGLTIVGDSVGISRSELKAAPLLYVDRAVGIAPWV